MTMEVDPPWNKDGLILDTMTCLHMDLGFPRHANQPGRRAGLREHAIRNLTRTLLWTNESKQAWTTSDFKSERRQQQQWTVQRGSTRCAMLLATSVCFIGSTCLWRGVAWRGLALQTPIEAQRYHLGR